MSDFEVTMPEFGELTESEREMVSNNGSGKEYASYIRVVYRGETIYLESDAMEPEDCRFTRDLGWIVGALRRAYELGKADASRTQERT